MPYTDTMFSFKTAGESHGQALVTVVEGIPSNIEVSTEFINQELRRRQAGFGRGGRMRIETDTVRVLSGIRHGRTLGSPISMLIENRDWVNWQDIMSVEPVSPEVAAKRKVTRPRPGHADLVGAQKYDQADARNILERSSARETTARVAVGAVAKLFLKPFDIEILSHTRSIGDVALPDDLVVSWEQIESVREDTVVRCVLEACAARMVAAIEQAQKDGDTLGGTFEVIVRNPPVGLGSHVSWERKLDARLAQAMMSINAVKAVSIGDGVAAASEPGSRVHDEITYDARARRFSRLSNRAGGIEGGMSNGEPIRVVGYLKPIPTLRKALRSVDMESKEPFLAAHERSDTCTVPAAGVIGEAMVAQVLADAVLEKFGGDSIGETLRNYAGYLDQLNRFPSS